jgi:hypothetical protein
MGTSAIADKRPTAKLSTRRSPSSALRPARADAVAIADASASTMTAALAGVGGGYLDGGRAHRDIDDDGIVIEIDFVATAMSSVEEAQSGNHPPPSQIFCLMCFPILQRPGCKSRKKPQRGG